MQCGFFLLWSQCSVTSRFSFRNNMNCIFVVYLIAAVWNTGHRRSGWLFRSSLSFPGQQAGRPKVLPTGFPKSPPSPLSLLYPTCCWKETWVLALLCCVHTICYLSSINMSRNGFIINYMLVWMQHPWAFNHPCGVTNVLHPLSSRTVFFLVFRT